ncbi:MAG: molybdopterin converting factor subunit 1 [Methanobacteriota archaeon]|nr:MAG: molybdopterin converting factor subunit 1 [Euryarchaeota archaeon]
MMQVQVRLFATYREIVGAGQLAWTLRDGTTVGQLVEAVLAKYPRLVGHGNRMLLAVNHEVVRSESVLREGDEVALLPPVSGGAR